MAESNFLVEHNARHVFHPMAHPADMERTPPRIIAGGEGTHVVDETGHRVLDGVAGLWNVNLGYSCRPIKQAIADELERLPYASNFRGQTNPRLIELSEKLTHLMEEERMTRFFFTSGGSDSVEVALRLARQYWKIRGQGDRYKFLALKRGYHGTHFGSASVNGNDRFRRNYEPLMPGVFHVPFPGVYRNPFGETDEARLSTICLNLIEEEIRFQGADTIAAFIVEPVLGAGGVFVPPPGFVKGVRALCDKHQILMIADEVVTGFGRTGAWFGARLWGVEPDLMCLAKAITSAYFPFGAVGIHQRLADEFLAADAARGGIYSGYTYSGHPVGCAAALAALEETYRLDLAGNAKRVGQHLRQRLDALADKHEMIGEVRGIGLMQALELVSDRATKAPAGSAFMASLADRAFEAGLLIRTSGNIVIFSPPLVLSQAEADQIADIMDGALAVAKAA
jgi:adenosylmethionine-8-amino-7-oxononanoate aminotransferase